MPPIYNLGDCPQCCGETCCVEFRFFLEYYRKSSTGTHNLDTKAFAVYKDGTLIKAMSTGGASVFTISPKSIDFSDLPESRDVDITYRIVWIKYGICDDDLTYTFEASGTVTATFYQDEEDEHYYHANISGIEACDEGEE